jgi:hypothetical protein
MAEAGGVELVVARSARLGGERLGRKISGM